MPFTSRAAAASSRSLEAVLMQGAGDEELADLVDSSTADESARRGADVAAGAVSQAARGNSLRPFGLAALLLGAAALAAVAVMARWSGQSARTGGIVTLDGVGADTRLTVARAAAVFESSDRWRPISTLVEGAQVVASGPPENRAGIQMLPIKAVIDGNGYRSLTGAVQLEVLRFGGGAGPGAGAGSLLPGDAATPVPRPAPGDVLTPRPRPAPSPFPSPAPAKQACQSAVVDGNYKVCKDTYCGQDIATDRGTTKVADDAVCRYLCDQEAKCIAYEVYHGAGTDCTLRPTCDSPTASEIGTFVAFKLHSPAGPFPSGPTPAPGGRFDCEANYASWTTVWSQEQKSWCCINVGRGCTTHPDPLAPTTLTTTPTPWRPVFDCGAGFETWQLGWSREKQRWCCLRVRRGCDEAPGQVIVTYTMTTVTSTSTTQPGTNTVTSTTATGRPDPFDCEAGYLNWKRGWSVWKKRWCCRYKHKGCPNGRQVTGSVHVRNVRFVPLNALPAVKNEFEESIRLALAELAADGNRDPIVMQRLLTPGSEYVRVDLEDWESAAGNVVVHFTIMPPQALPLHLVRQRVTCEAIDQVVLPVILHVRNIGAVSREPIHLTQCLVDLNTVRTPCTCSSGKPRMDHGCPVDGGNFCDSCDLGFRLVDNFQCKANICSCSNGIAAAGDACHTDGAEVCGYCVQGKHLEQLPDGRVFCSSNVCTCMDGVPARGQACATHNGNICESCVVGYHVDHTTHQCERNECSCLYGTRPEDGDAVCTKHEATICTSCFQFYHLAPQAYSHNKPCVQNECVCDRGTPAVGVGPPGCYAHMANVCVNCKGDLQLSRDYKCGLSECVCRNGTAARGDQCTSHGGNICTECEEGFVLIHAQCVRDMCQCTNGRAMTGDMCTDNGDQLCESCDEGYHLNGNLCEANVCLCQNGKAAQGATCLVNQGQVCAECKQGYHPEASTDGLGGRLLVQCQENKCSCANGQAATVFSSPYCHTHLSQICQSCNLGYAFAVDHSCPQKVCKCENGDGAVGLQCPIHGVEHCQTCTVGYHLTEEGVKFLGTKRCGLDGVVTSQPFDCQAAYDNRLLGWSRLKKHWCCEEQSIGCDAPPETGIQACENNQLPEQSCLAIGCCLFTAATGCRSAVGQSVCHQTRLVKLKPTVDGSAGAPADGDGLCMTTDNQVEVEFGVRLQKCNEHDFDMQWQWSDVTGALRNTLGLCIGIPDAESVALTSLAHWQGPVETVECDEADRFQRWAYDRLTARFAIADGLCLSVLPAEIHKAGAVITARPCEDNNPSQQWLLPPTAIATFTSTSSTTTTSITATTSTTGTTSSSTRTDTSTTTTSSTSSTGTTTTSTSSSTTGTTTTSTSTSTTGTTTTSTTTTRLTPRRLAAEAGSKALHGAAAGAA